MMTQKYVVARKDVHGGTLLKPFTDIKIQAFDARGEELTNEDLEKQGITNLQVFGGLVCRGMLFNIDEDGLSNDLIYNSPKYPIIGSQPKASLENKFAIKDDIQLEELLKYLNYNEYLTQKDLYKIFKMFIKNNRWLRQHMELFGWVKTDMGYCSGGDETISHDIYSKLRSISCSKNGKPNRVEDDYRLIKRRK